MWRLGSSRAVWPPGMKVIADVILPGGGLPGCHPV
jgi:hypothetical protein